MDKWELHKALFLVTTVLPDNHLGNIDKGLWATELVGVRENTD